MTFRVGQKVVFVGQPWKLKAYLQRLLHPYPGEMPVKGCIYTIENITPEDCLELLGLISPADDYWAAGFNPISFRPIVERKTDISIFKKMLIPKREHLPA